MEFDWPVQPRCDSQHILTDSQLPTLTTLLLSDNGLAKCDLPFLSSTCTLRSPSGPIDTVAGLSNLQLLDLSYNLLPCFPPQAGIASLQVGPAVPDCEHSPWLIVMMQTLYLFGNLITGQLPTQIGLMVQLTDLEIDDIQIIGPIPTGYALRASVPSRCLTFS